jgi:hypothetical protein
MNRIIVTAGIVSAALAFAPAAGADVAGISPFVGQWHAHEEGLTIDASGHGRETYADRSTCPNAPMSGCGITGTVDFMLSSVSGDTATGAITGASNPKEPIGGPVKVQLEGGGQGLNLWVAGGDQGFGFCNSNSPGSGLCGA